jgi:hypothetical protein
MLVLFASLVVEHKVQYFILISSFEEVLGNLDFKGGE